MDITLEILETIAYGIAFGVVLIVIDRYFTNRKKKDNGLFTDDGGASVP